MPKYEVTAPNIQALSVEHDLDLPMDIGITPDAVFLKYHGDKTDDALALFQHGVDLYWCHDNDSDTKEFETEYDQQAGQTRAKIVRV